jgi:electron transfer flavoprotein alpha subunit
VIDQGWLPMDRQVGKSGVSIKSKVYIAAGISGAPEHVEGIRGAGLVVAINTDPQAPIFNEAHYGVVGDAIDVLPALTEAVRAKKG